MKLKKTLLLLTTFLFNIFLCSGVDASSIDYNLQIDSNRNFYETIVYKFEINNQDSYLSSLLTNDVYFDVDKTIKYKKNIKKDKNNYTVVLKNSYDYKLFENSEILKKCFDDFSFNVDDYEISFYTISPFYCLDYADDIKVSIITDDNVIVSNADYKENNKYVWDVTSKDFGINMEIGQLNPDLNIEPPINNDLDVKNNIPIDLSVHIYDYDSIILIVGCLVFISIIVGVIIMRFKKKDKPKKKETDFDF